MAVLSLEIEAKYDELMEARRKVAELEDAMRNFDPELGTNFFRDLQNELGAAKAKERELIAETQQMVSVLDNQTPAALRKAKDELDKNIESRNNLLTVTRQLRDEEERLQKEYVEAQRGVADGSVTTEELEVKRKNLIQVTTELSRKEEELFNKSREVTRQMAELEGASQSMQARQAGVRDESSALDGAVEQLTGKFKMMSGMLIGATGLEQFMERMVKTRQEFQQMETSIQTLVGSEEKSAVLISELKKQAAASPLDFSSMVGATQTMLGFNIEAEKIPRFISAIGDVSMGNAQRFASLSLAFSQMSATGKLMGQDLNQMINAGFNPLSVMAEKTGKSIGELKEEMSKGAISAEMVQQAFIDATSEGGKFFGMSEAASKTISGQFSMLQDATDAMFNELGEKSEGMIVSLVSGGVAIVEHYKEVGTIIAALATTYGVLKAAVLANIAMEEAETALRAKNITVTTGAVIKEALLTKAKGAHAVATGVLTAAQAALNAVMMANPIVLLITSLALLGVAIGTVIALTNDERDAVAEYNEEKKQQAEAEQKLREDMQKNVDVARDDTKSTKERQEALEALRNTYPSLFTNMDIEKMKTIDLIKLKKQMSELDEKRAEQNDKESRDKLRREIAYYKDRARMQKRDGYSDKEDNETAAYKQKKLDASVADLVMTESGKAATANLQYSKNVVKKYENLLKVNASRYRIKLNGEVVDVTRSQLEQLKNAYDKNVEKHKDDKQGTAASYIESAKAEWERAKKAVETLKGSKKSYQSEEEYLKALEAAESEEKKARAKWQSLGGKEEKRRAARTVRKRTIDTEALDEAETRRKEKAALDLENARIEIMKEGTEKEMAELEFRRKKELYALNTEEKQNKDAYMRSMKARYENKGGTDWDKSQAKKTASEGFDNTTFAERRLVIEKKYAQEREKMQMAELEGMRKYLEEYGTYEEKRLAIAQRYEEEIAKAHTEGEKKSLQRQREKEMITLELDAIQRDIDWASLFEGMGDVMNATIDSVVAQMKEKMQTAEYAMLDDSVKNDYRKKLQEIQGRKEGRMNDVSFKAIGEATERLRTAQEELLHSMEERVDAEGKLAEAEFALQLATENLKEEEAKGGVSQGTRDNVAARQTEVEARREAVRVAGNAQSRAEVGVSMAQDELRDKTEKATDGLNGFADALHDLAGGSLTSVFNGVTKVIASFSNKTDSAGNALSSLGGKAGGIVGAILSILDMLKDDAAKFITNIIDMVSKAVTGIIDQIASGELFKQVGSSVVSLVDNVAGSLINAATFGSEKKEEREWVEKMEALRLSNENLASAVDALTDKMEEANTSAEATSIYEDAKDKLVKLIEGTSKDIVETTGKSSNGTFGIGGYHSAVYKVNDKLSQQDWNTIAEATGLDVLRKGKAGAFFALSSEDMKKVYDYARGYYNKIIEASKDAKYNANEQMKSYIDYAEQLEELEKKHREQITGIDFDGMVDNFVNSLMDMKNSASDWAKDINKTMTQMLLKDYVGESVKKKMQDWYEQYTKELEDNGGKLSASRAAFYKEWQKDIYSNAEAEARKIFELTDYDTDVASQNASSRSVASMSEDTANELNGRFTAIQMTTASIDTKLASLVAGNTEQLQISTSLLELVNRSYLELQGIRENTLAVVQPIKDMRDRLEKIEGYTSRL
ncbi:MAG: tape measure protein [Bacteroidaceae bacterium]|nr:tape measure protein [Bacteroidaceae bacterium]